MPEVAAEASIRWFLAQVPLAHHGRGIARLAQYFRNRYPAIQGCAPRLVAVQPGQQGHTRRMALGCVVKPRKAQTIRREPIDIRRFDFTSVASKVCVAEVVDHHEYDVGTRSTMKVKPREEHDRKDVAYSHVEGYN